MVEFVASIDVETLDRGDSDMYSTPVGRNHCTHFHLRTDNRCCYTPRGTGCQDRCHRKMYRRSTRRR